MRPRFSGLFKYLNRALTGVGAAFIGAVLTFGLFMLVLFLAGSLRNKLEKFISQNFISENYTSPLAVTEQGTARVDTYVDDLVGQEENLTYLSFTDLFSGFGWLDQSKTTLFHDYSATAFYLPPVLKWEKITHNPLSSANYIQAYSLSGVSKSIFLGQEKINLPAAFEDKQVIGLSVQKLKTSLLVGVVSQIGKSYQAEVFILNNSGSEFKKPIINFSSSYPGVWGFGGQEGNWLAIYGAYKGAGYQVVDGQPEDISRFFDIRLMGGGFWPAAVYNGDSWYVWNSKESGPARLLKLFENGTGKIQGVASLTDRLPLSDAKEMKIALAADNNPIVEAIGQLGRQHWKLLDQGFDNSKSYEIYSLNLLGYPAQTRFIAISGVSYSSGGAAIRWLVSADSENWQELKLGELKELNESATRLFWKAEINPSDNPKYSPFLEDVQLNYRVRLFE